MALLFLADLPAPRALRAGSVLTAAGEFSFVLFPFGAALGAPSAPGRPVCGDRGRDHAVRAAGRSPAEGAAPAAGRGRAHADDFSDARGSVLLIGFGRFGQIVSQCLLAEDVDVTTIDNDPDMIRDAGRFGFKVYYGDGTRLDVLRAAGAADVRLIAICIDDREAASRVVDLVHAEFPGVKLYVRAYDRRHTLQLIAKDVDFSVRETFKSALVLGRKALEALGLEAERAGAVIDFVRSRDRSASRCSRPKASPPVSN